VSYRMLEINKIEDKKKRKKRDKKDREVEVSILFDIAKVRATRHGTYHSSCASVKWHCARNRAAKSAN